MGERIIFAVAGSGKTTTVLNSIPDDKRSLIITYTLENLRSLEAKLIKKYGRVPDHICLMSYFSFLYRFCFRPFFSYHLRNKGLTWNPPKYYPGAPSKSKLAHYLTKKKYLYANRVAKLIIEMKAVEKVVARLEKHFDCFFLDEVQDFAGNDFNFVLELSKANIELLFVGDFFQHTFDTSRDGPVRRNLHKKGVDSYLAEFKKVGFEIDTESLSKTYRCSPAICEFITNVIGIPIESHRKDQTRIIFIEEKIQAIEVFKDDTKVKLFYQDFIKYPCHSNNWGKCKGLNNYGDVCVVMNATTMKLFKKERLCELPDSSRNKLYVACSRAHGDLYIVDEKYVKSYKGTE